MIEHVKIFFDGVLVGVPLVVVLWMVSWRSGKFIDQAISGCSLDSSYGFAEKMLWCLIGLMFFLLACGISFVLYAIGSIFA